MKLLKTFPLTLLCVAAIWYLCFFKPPTTRLSHTPFIDKWVHIAMYAGTCTVLWWEYLRSHARRRGRALLIGAVAAPILMSGLIELLQATLTTTRSGDWWDLAANTAGVLLATAVGRGLLWHHVRPGR